MASRFQFFVLLVVVLLAFKYVVMIIIPDIPENVQNLMKRQENIKEEISGLRKSNKPLMRGGFPDLFSRLDIEKVIKYDLDLKETSNKVKKEGI